ncbi:hypothetical protein, partial [Clostridium perfringens]
GTAGAEMGEDRRGANRRITAVSVTEREARSRRFSAAFQFVILVGVAAIAALFLAERMGQVLSRPLAAVSAELGGGAS